MNKKFTYRHLILGIILSILVFILGIRLNNYRDFQNQEYFNGFNESFSFKITDIVKFNHKLRSGHDYHVLKGKIIRSSIKSYKPQFSDNTYCYFSDSLIWIIAIGNKSYNIDDIIFFNGIVDSTYLFRKSKLIYSWKPRIETGNAKYAMEYIYSNFPK